MRRFIFASYFAMVVYGLALTPSPLQGQPYPNRPIQLIVTMGTGAAGDIYARLLAEELKKILKTEIIVVNKPGASMVMGTDLVAKSKKDGYTIVYTNAAAMVYSRVIEPEMVPYDPMKDFEPLGLHLLLPIAFAVPKNSPWKNFPEFADYGKKNPEKISISSPGIQTACSFDLAILETLTGARFIQVPYKEGRAPITSMLGGHVDATTFAFSGLIPFVNSGDIRIILTSKKVSDFPNVPTITEFGYKQELPSPWFALYAPAGIPEEVKKVLVSAIKQAVNSPEVVGKIDKIGGSVVDYKSPAELKKLMQEEYEAISAIAAKIGSRK